MLRLCVMASVAVFSTQALAADYPERIRRALETFQQVCAKIGGRPGSLAGAVTSLDIDGDGQRDYVIDLGNVSCEGRPDAYCVNGFCALEVYTWRGKNDWRPVLSATASDWRAGYVDSRPALILSQRGSFCDQPQRKTCTVIFTFVDGKMYRQTE